MTVSAAQKQYRQEMIRAYEVGKSVLLDTVTTEAVIKGNQAEFLVSGSGGATAKTRGANGRIPGRTDSNTQTTVDLVEWHDKAEKTGFDIFASQGDQRALMQRTTMEVMNRQVNDDILTALGTGTVNWGPAAAATETLALKAKTILQNAKVPWDRNIFAVISPAFESYLMQIDSYSSTDYVDSRPMVDGGGWNDMPQMKTWIGVNWVPYPELTGAGTANEMCFMYHKSAVGHATNTGGMQTAIGYNEEDDYSFARCTCFMGTQVLQNSGIVVMPHDGSAFAA